MKIFNEEMNQIIENPDLKKGYLINKEIVQEPEIPEKYHFEEIKYKNGGIARFKKIDSPRIPTKYETVQIFIPYTEQELKQNEEMELKHELELYTQDFIQVLCGAVIPDFETRKTEFKTKHNRLRELEKKPPRQYN